MRTVYQAGYRNQGKEIMQLLASDKNIILIDLRDTAWSPRGEWQQGSLACCLSWHYQWLGPWLGNPNHSIPGAPIILSKPEPGLQKICNALRRGHDLIFLCACEKFERCHRHLVWEELQKMWKAEHEERLGPLTIKAIV